MIKKMFFTNCFVLIFAAFLTNTAQAVDPNLVGWWKLNEIADVNATDSSGNGNDGTLAGNPQWVTGILDGALEFDGNGDYINCGNGPTLQIQDQITLACWIRVPQFTRNWATIISKGDSSYRLSRGESNYAVHMGFNGATSMPYSWFDGKKAVNDDQWHHIVGLYDGTEARIYVDGKLDASQAATGQMYATDYPVYIGENSQATGRYWDGLIDDARIYNKALSEDEILVIMTGAAEMPKRASEPNPDNKATDVYRDVILSWKPEEFAYKHDVYFGKNFDDVNTATPTNDPAGVYIGRIDPNFYPENGAIRLEFSQDYYWRVDEINSPPDSTIYRGQIWRFKAEQIAYQISAEHIIPTASSQDEDQGPENTINESGLTGDKHSNDVYDMWISAAGEPAPAWIQYEFDKVYQLHEMLVWNFNGPFILIGSGIKSVTVEHSIDGYDWKQIDNVSQFAQATGTTSYTYNTVIDFNDIAVKYVKITANSNWNSALFSQFGLSEVRFMQIPATAKEPAPDIEETDVPINTTLTWKPGRNASEHNVYLSTDEQSVMDGTAPVVSIDEASYGPLSLDLETQYYWQVNEVNNSEATPIWEGDIWNFTTQKYLVVEDFESYNEIPSGQEGSKLVYETWSDGYDNPSINGSAIGYTSGDSLETATVNSGEQSVPLIYNNTVASSSEVSIETTDLDIGSDWSIGSPEMLVMWFCGDPANATTEQMYAKINGVKVLYPDLHNLAIRRWNQWSIDLASLGVNLGNIKTLSIGFERTGSTGGSGTILIDDIRLYRSAPAIPEPVDPGQTGLVAYYPFNNQATDATGNGYNGTYLDDARVEAGVLFLDGIDDAVAIPRIGGEGAVYNECTYSMFVYPTVDQETLIYSGGINTDNWVSGAIHFKVVYGFVNVGINGAGNDLQGKTIITPNIWSHIAMTVSESAITVYLNGLQEATRELETPLTNLILGDATIGAYNENGENVQREFTGQIDEVRIYDRALSDDEIFFLAEQLL